eukprot:TRINITY_DN776_c0_g1_i2.p1 TRINITY_DN776_c0_g1~~TRINITY_DN776_c0_g1_i2.p1  ORF type:complete len:104 (-),score=28.96 TRINITY_DN776_c0_g1_i2:255-566(-)
MCIRDRSTGVVPLADCSVLFVDENVIRKKNCFQVTTRFRNYFLVAKDEFDMASWMEAINIAKDVKSDDTKEIPDSLKIFNHLNSILAQLSELEKPAIATKRGW